jgi:hypothetical protein
MQTGEWQPGTLERKRAARQALPGVLAQWMTGEPHPGAVSPTAPDKASSIGQLWAEILVRAVRAGEILARWSAAAQRTDGELARVLADAASGAIAELAAGVLALHGKAPMDATGLLEKAEQFIDEVDDEDDGIMHSTGALAALLERWPSAHAGAEPEHHKLAAAVLGALAPLLAQDACVQSRPPTRQRRE